MMDDDGVGRVLVACEFSGVVRDAFISRGFDAWSCDLLLSERPRDARAHPEHLKAGLQKRAHEN
ncbi:MAG: hypothetical protein DRQ88_12385 [Epsilonproteobacteria bacterium]|nr:MAG: hypothetical protein DRQ88_12385 [Campylobacterota bacterium]